MGQDFEFGLPLSIGQDLRLGRPPQMSQPPWSCDLSDNRTYHLGNADYVLYKISENPVIQQVVYLLGRAFFNLAPVVQIGSDFFSVETAPALSTNRTTLRALTGELTLYKLMFDDYDHRGTSSDYLQNAFRLDRNPGVGTYAAPWKGNAIYYGDNAGFTYALYDYGDARIFTNLMPESEGKLGAQIPDDARQHVHAKITTILDYYTSKPGQNLIREITGNFEFPGSSDEFMGLDWKLTTRLRKIKHILERNLTPS